MLSRLGSRLSYANVVSTACLFIVLGGTSYAVATGSIDSREIKNSTVRSKDIRNNTVRSRDVRNSSLLAEDFAPGQLPAGPKGETGPVGPPGVSALERVQADSANNSNSTKGATATCPLGKRVLGMGGFLQGGASGSDPNAVTDVVLTRIFPNATLTTVSVLAIEDKPSPEFWKVSAFAICGRVAA